MQQAYRCAWKFQSDWLDYSSHNHYGDVTMGVIAYQITSLTIVYSSVYSDADQRKRHQSSAALNSPHKWPVTRKMFPFDDVIMIVDHFCKIFSCDVFSDVKPDRWFYTRYMNEPLCLFSRNCKYILTFHMVPQHWDGIGSWIISSWKIRSCSSFSQCHCRYNGCWWPDDRKIHVINRHGIDLLLPEYSSAPSRTNTDNKTGLIGPWEKFKISC